MSVVFQAGEDMKLSAYNVCIGVKQRRYPWEACIRSALTVADEFCIAYDRRFDDPDIFTAVDARVRPVEVDLDFLEWDFINHALTIARRECKGDWCLYLEADEVLHEKDAPKILASLEVAEAADAEAVNIRYLEPYQNYIVPQFFNGSGRQKITINAPWLYHKTSDYMTVNVDSDIWDGRAIKVSEFDDVAYYDERSNAWFFDPRGLRPDYPALDDDTTAGIEYTAENYTHVWHYADYNHSRKLEQARQNAIWQDRVYARTLDLDVSALEVLLNETIVMKPEVARDGLEWITNERGGIKVSLDHPSSVQAWLETMTLDSA